MPLIYSFVWISTQAPKNESKTRLNVKVLYRPAPLGLIDLAFYKDCHGKNPIIISQKKKNSAIVQN